MGYKSQSSRKISAPSDPQRGKYGGENFSSTLPPTKLHHHTPQTCIIISAAVSPTHPETLVKILGPFFLLAYWILS